MEGFNTIVITDRKREGFYKQFNFIDTVLSFDKIDEAVDLINRNEESVLVPHGSLVEYLGQERVNKITTKFLGIEIYLSGKEISTRRCFCLKHPTSKFLKRLKDQKTLIG